MTAHQPTHDQAHEANIQERERGREVLIAGLRESNAAMRAEVLRLREDIASNETLRLVNSANEELSKYISVIEAKLNAVTSERDECRKDIAEAAGELMIDMATAPPGSDTARLILANVAMRRERDASWKAKQKASRELVELRERAEGAEFKAANLSQNQTGHAAEWRKWAKVVLDNHHNANTNEDLRNAIEQEIHGLTKRAENSEAERDKYRDAYNALLQDHRTTPVDATPAEQPGMAGEDKCERCAFARSVIRQANEYLDKGQAEEPTS